MQKINSFHRAARYAADVAVVLLGSELKGEEVKKVLQRGDDYPTVTARLLSIADSTQFRLAARLASRLGIKEPSRCGVEYKCFDMVNGFITPVYKPTSAAERRALSRKYRFPMLIKD